jgi:hypothetical protein
MAAKAILGAVLLIAFCGSAFAQALRVAVISDLNGSYGSTDYNPRVATAVERIIALAPDLVLSTGDMVAGQRRPALTEPEVRAMWDAFHATVSEPLRRAGIPLMVTPGNHDASAYGGFEGERRIFAEEWRARKPALDYVDDGDYPFFYAFRMKGVTFVSLDATTIGPLRGGQAERLRAVAKGAETLVGFSHLPLWPFAVGRETEIIGDADLQGLFRSIDLDLHLSGHHHAFYPGWKDGTAFVSQACLGGGPRRLLGTDARSAHAITFLEIAEQGDIDITAFQGPDFSHPMDWADLPPRLTHGSVALQRLDLVAGSR